MKYLKPFLLSLIPAFIVTFAMVILERGWDIFNVGTLNVFWMTFLSYFIKFTLIFNSKSHVWQNFNKSFYFRLVTYLRVKK